MCIRATSSLVHIWILEYYLKYIFNAIMLYILLFDL